MRQAWRLIGSVVALAAVVGVLAMVAEVVPVR
jgi:hypothetical protein